MQTDYFPSHTEPQPGSLAGRPGGKKWVVDLLQIVIAYTLSRVADLDFGHLIRSHFVRKIDGDRRTTDPSQSENDDRYPENQKRQNE